MGWYTTTLLGLTTLAVLVTSHHIPDYKLLPPLQKHIPPSNVATFQRTSVESLPAFTGLNDNAVNPEFGSVSLPLRDAVEASNYDKISVKSQPFRSLEGYTPERFNIKSGLRDAVERRPPPPLGINILSHKSIWLEQLGAPAIRHKHIAAKIICHLDSDAVNRIEPFSLLPQVLPKRKCSHIVYNGAILDPHDSTVKSKNPEYDEIQGGFRAVTGLAKKDPSLRILLSIKFDENFSCCGKTSQSILSFIEEYGFDGIEMDWKNAQRADLKSLLKILNGIFKSNGYMIAIAVGPNDYVDLELASLADLIFLRAWDPYVLEEKISHHPSTMKLVSSLAKKWTEIGVNPSKIILSTPLFGYSYTMKYKNETDVGAPVAGHGIEGPYTKEAGCLSYYEICEMINQDSSWTAGRDEEGAYLKRGDQWIGFDDPISVKLKVAYIKSFGLGGLSLYTLDLDDFVGICGDPWPMLTTALEDLGVYDIPIDQCEEDGIISDPSNCAGYFSCDNGELYRGICGVGRFFDASKKQCVKASPEICRPGYRKTSPGESTSVVSNGRLDKYQSYKFPELEIRDNGLKVVCYITSWANYRQTEAKFVPEHLDANLCTHVVYAFAGLNPDRLTIQPFDPWADIENKLYERITSLKPAKILLALGGWTDSPGDKYSRLVSNPAARSKFIANVISFLKANNFDGLSVEWNYPKCWQSDCARGPDSDRPNFTKFIQELREEFDNVEPSLVLAVSISGYKEVIERAYDIKQLSQVADFISVMTYDYHGAWESNTGHLSPLFAKPGDKNPNYNIDWTMNYLLSLGAEKSKLIPGIPFYGQSYRLSQADHSNLGDSASGPGMPGEFTRQPGMLAYYEICDRIKRKNWKIGPGPSAHNKDQFVSYEDVMSIEKKGNWVVENGFGGLTAWTVDLDDFRNKCCFESFPLLRSLNRALGRLLNKPPTGENCQSPEEPITPQPPTMTAHSDSNDGGPIPTRPITSSTTMKSTTWPSWTERPSNKPSTAGTTWPTWSWTTVTTPRVTTERITTKRPTTKMPTTKKPVIDESIMPSKPCNSGEYIPDPNNCGNYYRCVQGELKRQSCAPGLHWDDRRKLCDRPSAAKCQNTMMTQRPSSTQRIPTQRPTTIPIRPINNRPSTIKPVMTPVATPTKGCEHGQYYAYPESCNHFLVCVNDNLVIQQCGSGLNWNQKKNMCDWAHKNPCVDKPKINSQLVMREVTKNEPCIPGSNTGVPGECENYQSCLWGRYEKFACAPGLHFNQEARLCDWPVRAKCDLSQSTISSIDEFSTFGSTTIRPQKPVYGLTTTTRKPVYGLTTTTRKPLYETTVTTTQKPKLPAVNIDPNKVSPLSGYYKVVCYFTNWAWYRGGVGRYLPEHIDHTLCTHIIYGFAVLDSSELTIKAHDSWADYDNHFYERVVAYKKRGLKVLLALGGWNDSAGGKYSRLVNSPSARRKFIEHALKFINKFGFDGIDLDWEYPVCWQVDCSKGPASDKQGFAALLEELSGELKPRGLLLSAAVSPSKTVIDKGYDVPALAKYLDWISVMTYDYHGQWDKKTGHVAPLYYHERDEVYHFNANFTINYWISKGAPARKIIMGVPLYGQAFSIHDPKAGNGLNVPASAGKAGEFTKAAGFLAYYEICDRVKNHGWKIVQDPYRRMGPYAYKGSQWVSFDDSNMVRQKAQFIRDMGIGGGMVWALDLDDFRGRCGYGPHPLMHTLQQVLSEPPNKHDRPIKLPAIGQDLSWKPAKETPPKSSKPLVPMGGKKNASEIDGGYKVVCYFTNWAWYRQEGGKFLPEDIDADLCTHIIYGFAVLDGSSLTIKTHDSWADIDNKFYERVVAYKAKGIKVLLAIGGWNDSAGDKYSKLVNSPSSRSRFITDVVQFIEKYGFDGLDLDWEYPVCWQVDCNKGPQSDKQSFTAWVKELSETFKPKGLLLSSAVSPSQRVINAGYDVSVLAEYLDWISVMTYDFHGQWDKKTGHVAPLYERPDDWEPTFNANFSINYWIEQGAPPKKLVMGAPLYGQSFSLAERSQRGLNAPTYGGGEAGEATRARGFLAYYEICERILTKGWTVVQDPKRRIGPYAYSGDQWVSFDDTEQIRLKAELIKKLGLGGGMVWALDLDDFKNRCGCEPSPLLRTMNRVLRNYPPGPSCSLSGIDNFEQMEPQPYPTSTESSSSPSWSWSPPKITTMKSPTTIDPSDSVVVIAGPQPPPALPIGECEGRKQFQPHEKDCSKYIVCNFGQLSERTCPNGLHWNQDRCDWPENGKCKQKVEENNEIPSEKPDRPMAIITTTTPEPVNAGIISNDNYTKGDYKVICYFTNWAWYRPGSGKYLPENIDANLCTHIIYGFTVLDYETLTIKIHDSWADIDNEFYRKVTAYKAKGIKVSVALGGWNDSAGDKYSRLVNNPTARSRFIKHAIEFIEKYGFDGLDLDWEYPVCWQVNCDRGPASDKKAFASLVKELSKKFKEKNYLLSAAVSPSKRVIDHGYDVPVLGQFLDWIAVMTYDFHGHWETKTGHVAPLYYYPGDEFDYFNANFSMRYWIEKGAPSSKLVMGIPLYGQSFTLSNRATTGLQSSISGPGHAGSFTRAPGFLAFYEICDNVLTGGWQVTRDSGYRIGPYAVRDDQWVGYDDVTNVLQKATFIRELNLAGGMVWALDLDDFNGICGCGKYPLLSALNRGLGSVPVYGKDCT